MQASTGEQSASYGQFGEDRVLAEIFASRTEGYCVEIGAYDGRTGSASYPFEQRGWHCLLVEPIPELVKEIKRHRSCLVRNCALSNHDGTARFYVAEHVEQMSTLDLTEGHRAWIEQVGGEVREITVPVTTLDSVLAEAAFPEIQFLTIDVEGHELAVLEGFSLEVHRPRIVIIEDNSVSGDARIAEHMAAHGYVHFKRTGVNEWFAHETDGDLVRPEELRSFARERDRQRRARRRAFVLNRLATSLGRVLPDAVKRPLRAIIDRIRSNGGS